MVYKTLCIVCLLLHAYVIMDIHHLNSVIIDVVIQGMHTNNALVFEEDSYCEPEHDNNESEIIHSN